MKLTKESLSKQLLASILGIYVLITLSVTVIHIFIEYRYTKENIKSELSGIAHIFEPALQTAIWNLNDEQLQSIGHGINEMSLVYKVVIVDPNNKILYQSKLQDGDTIHDKELTYSFPIHQTLNGNNIFLAKATLYSSEQAIFERLKVGLFMLFLNALIKSAALILLFYLAFRKHLQKPLTALINQISNVKEGGSGSHLVDVKFEHSNELSMLQKKFNELLEHIYSSEKQRIKIAEKHSSELEKLVKERTMELEEANTQLQRLASTDSLTQIANRSRLDEALAHAMVMNKRYGYSFCVLLLDIDLFKNFNDNYGHLMGDRVLQKLAVLLKNSIRTTDVVGRWGGEEFMVVCYETQTEGALIMAENIRKLVCSNNFDDIGHVSVSIGVAEYQQASSISELVRQADHALYYSKEHGRNMVSVYNETIVM